MRRKDREITNEKQIMEFIDREQILRVAFYDEGDIYIVPVNYGYTYDKQYTFYFHGAIAGRKYELAKANPTVGFEIDGNYTCAESNTPFSFNVTFQSVIGNGSVCLVEDEEEKKKGLNAIFKQVGACEEWPANQEIPHNMAIFRLDVNQLSCKKAT